MAHNCVERNLTKLKNVLEDKLLFSESLTKHVFLTVLEILWNIGLGKKPCVKRFKKGSIQKLKSHKKLIRFILDKNKSLKKRKKKFLDGSKSFRKAIKGALDQFFEHCIEETV